jgi:DNA (cytosine-5)-methyltransferase 1
VKIGSLCTGYGGLDMAVEAYFDAEMVWCAENDKYASQLIVQRFNKPNLGDIKQIKWDEVESIDILTAGYPCQPFSHAGQRKGENDERHIWPYILKGISILRPKYIILENVKGHLSLGFKEVLKDLAQIGYDARWSIVRASDVGAPHQRARLFIIAYPASSRRYDVRQKLSNGFEQGSETATNTSSERQERQKSVTELERQRSSKYSETLTDTNNTRRVGHVQRLSKRFNSSDEMCLQEVPNTLEQDKLNPKFVEYMMGLLPGWVTDLGLSRAQQLKMLGNGVVPQQAYYALELLHG